MSDGAARHLSYSICFQSARASRVVEMPRAADDGTFLFSELPRLQAPSPVRPTPLAALLRSSSSPGPQPPAWAQCLQPGRFRWCLPAAIAGRGSESLWPTWAELWGLGSGVFGGFGFF